MREIIEWFNKNLDELNKSLLEDSPEVIDEEEEDTWDESDDAFIQEAFKKMMGVNWNE